MLTPAYRLVSQIFEEGTAYPVVVHVFNGGSEAQVKRLYAAHQRTDSFLRGCAVEGKFGDFKCRESKKLQRWDGRKWV